jgi:hypothetical protein
MTLPAVASLARSAPPTIDPAATPQDPAQAHARNPEKQEAAEEQEPGTMLALARGVSPQGRANDSGEVRIDVGGKAHNVAGGV